MHRNKRNSWRAELETALNSGRPVCISIIIGFDPREDRREMRTASTNNVLIVVGSSHK